MPDLSDVAPGEDLVAIGADLEPGTLLAAYRNGLFPMPVDPRRRRSKMAWFSPDPRGIIPLDGLHVSRSLHRSMRRFDVTIDTRFGDVVRACADPKRPGRWITTPIIDAYTTLFELGWGHSVAKGWGLTADVGVLIGSPSVTGTLSPSLRAKISATGRDPDAELERELQTVRDTAAKFDVLPVLSLGLSYRW